MTQQEFYLVMMRIDENRQNELRAIDNDIDGLNNDIDGLNKHIRSLMDEIDAIQQKKRALSQAKRQIHKDYDEKKREVMEQYVFGYGKEGGEQ